VPPGLSVFDLIMPWKAEIAEQTITNLEKNGLSKVVSCSGKSQVHTLDLAKHADDVQAILINPPWNCCKVN